MTKLLDMKAKTRLFLSGLMVLGMVSCSTKIIDTVEVDDGKHRVSFDHVVEVMKQTGKDLPSLYKETSAGGLALNYSRKMNR